jgi:hypothetical protein
MGQLHDVIANMIVITRVAYDCQNNYVSCANCNIWSLYISNVNKSYASSYTRLSVQLAEDEKQFLPKQLSLHMDNQTNGGAVEILSNETGQNVTQYFTYNPDKNSVTVSNSTMNADFAIQVPDPSDPNTAIIHRINLPFLDVFSITKHAATNTTGAFTTYSSVEDIPITMGNTTYSELVMHVSIPKDFEHNMAVMDMYLTMNRLGL